MAFKDLPADELKKVAEFFVVDVVSVKEEPTKKELLAALASGDDPVTWEQYEELYLKVENKPAPVVEDETVTDDDEPVKELSTVLKMERPNGMFSIRGYVFTQEHPYRPVTDEDADWIVTHEHGFRRATTQEVADYYS